MREHDTVTRTGTGPRRVKDVIDVNFGRPRSTNVVTTDRSNELQSRAIDSIHDETERAMEQAEGRA